MPTAITPRFYDSAGRDVALAGELGEGGEAKVYAIAGDPTRVLKVYLRRPPMDQLPKLRAMAALKNQDLLSVTTWPLDVSFVKDQQLAGYTMPRLKDFHPLHTLFGPKARQQLYPNMTWKALVTMASNTAQAIAVLHHFNIVMGDVNANNIVVHDDSKITLVDCDSYAFTYNGELFPCRVGMDEYQPPELQPDRWSTLPRTQEGDRFGLAVIIFQLLMMGRHPFEGVNTHRKLADPTRAANIARGFFFYGPGAAVHGLQPPPAALTLGALSPRVANLFVRAFAGTPAQRPTALEWHAALVDLASQLICCKANPTHVYLKSGQCPWCAIERQTKGQISYFQLPVPFSSDGKIDDSIWATFPDAKLTELWRAILGLGAPTVTYRPTRGAVRAITLRPKPLPPDLRKRGLILGGALAVAWSLILILLLTQHGMIASALAVVTLCAWPFVRIEGNGELQERRDSLAAAREDFNRAEDRWRSLGGAMEYHELRARLEAVTNSLLGQRQRYDAEVSALKAHQQEANRRAFLDGQLIASSRIKGIGPKLTGTLAAWNIESAFDVDYTRIVNIPGFGPAKASALVSWRTGLEQQFNRRPPAPLADAVLRPVTTKYVRTRVQGREELIAGKTRIASLLPELAKAAPEAQAAAAASRARLNQAMADALVMPRFIYRTS
ncbi:MAG TPA: protein kinase [Candidatus Binatia bacterium]|nr:protein kinase [Candidatus Binatia bacterium]